MEYEILSILIKDYLRKYDFKLNPKTLQIETIKDRTLNITIYNYIDIFIEKCQLTSKEKSIPINQNVGNDKDLTNLFN